MSAINRCLPPPTSRAAPPELGSLFLSLISAYQMPTRLKVLSAWPTEGSTATSDAYLVAEPLLGFGGDEQTVGTWVTRRPTTS